MGLPELPVKSLLDQYKYSDCHKKQAFSSKHFPVVTTERYRRFSVFLYIQKISVLTLNGLDLMFRATGSVPKYFLDQEPERKHLALWHRVQTGQATKGREQLQASYKKLLHFIKIHHWKFLNGRKELSYKAGFFLSCTLTLTKYLCACAEWSLEPGELRTIPNRLHFRLREGEHCYLYPHTAPPGAIHTVLQLNTVKWGYGHIFVTWLFILISVCSGLHKWWCPTYLLLVRGS